MSRIVVAARVKRRRARTRDETKTYDGPYTSSAGQKGLPFYGGPKGFGLKQLDNWGANKYCSGEQRWNWKQNVDGGYEVLESKLDAKGNYDLRYYLNQIINKLKADKNVKLEMKDFTIGNYTFTLGNNTTYFPSYDLKITVPDGKYSFLVAALIKMYNGGSIIESLTEHVEKEVNNETGDIVDVKYLKINIDTNSTTDNSDKTKRPYLFKVLDPK